MNYFAFTLLLSIILFLTPMAIFSKLAAAPSAAQHKEQASKNKGHYVYQELIEKHQNAIEFKESEEGIYGSGLSQELLNLSDLYQKQGDHNRAIDTLKRSLHLTRINEGLYSRNQIPIVEKLIFNLKANKQWDRVNDQYYNLYQIYHRHYSDNDVELLDVELTLANWHLQSSLLDLFPKPLNGLIASHSLFTQADKLISERYGENDIRLIQTLNGLMITQYLLSINVGKLEMPKVLNGDFQMSTETNYVTKVLRNSFVSGRNLIEREINVLEFQAVKNYRDITKSKLKLADWYLLNNKKQSALRSYQTAYDYALSNDSNNDFTQILFGQPVTLPDLPYLNNIARTDISAENLPEDVKYIEVKMDVTRYGAARNIKVIRAKPEQGIAKRYKVLTYLRNVTLRPQFVNGVPVGIKELPFHVFINN
jgi:hypothetical protein